MGIMKTFLCFDCSHHYVSIYFKGGKFYHIKLYFSKSWKNVRVPTVGYKQLAEPDLILCVHTVQL